LKVKVFYHDKCFDGASSAALFSRFYRERIRSDVDFEFSGLLHRAGALFDESHFDGNENAIVDFKYSSSPKNYLVVRSSRERIFVSGGRRAL
jgi:hypothetical protein